MKNIQNYLNYKPVVVSFFDFRTNTVSYLVYDNESKEAAVIDSVLDYEPNGATVYHEGADKILKEIDSRNLKLTWILETHAHADHLTAAQYIKKRIGGKIGIGKNITSIQKLFGEIFYEGEEFDSNGSKFDKLFEDGEEFKLGKIPVRVIYTPGHTPADYTFIFGDAVFPGDTIFMPDFGSARCDFPNGSAEQLYKSVQKIFELPEQMRMFVCHDYLPKNRDDYRWETSIAEQKKKNIHFRNGTSSTKFIKMRNDRDLTLDMPKLIIPSIQVNIRAGELPINTNNKIFFKVPVNSVFSKLIK
jgi:glyoxylase-like metal-dependent hydrolase (beta-lactamase superfamily II)